MEIKKERIEISGNRYLIYYTFTSSEDEKKQAAKEGEKK
jgi:hypothetical protein